MSIQASKVAPSVQPWITRSQLELLQTTPNGWSERTRAIELVARAMDGGGGGAK
uniref:Uncharacterized protein n=1 Tax=Nelumbo nucifera TaxID=4432 RepID=A0A822ZT94_NELNU|nr:TPA_asm: hypothetical protein HUJ06_016708 [Nelumbo nucifera]